MGVVRYLSHPQVRISAEIPVPRWGLSDIGRERTEAMCGQSWLDSTTRLVTSGETKALETAAIIAAATGLPIEVRPSTHENDRSGTGFVPPDRFEQLADAFFAEPDVSVEGWETAADAQRRIVSATAGLFDDADSGDVLICGHGGVGTLLMCHLLEVPISRQYDQSGPPAAPGGGNYWAYDLAAGQLLHQWLSI